MSRPRQVNVFNSSVVTEDPDLGSPNQACPGGGPGVGVGGGPNAKYPNCKAQGNLLIIQNPAVPANRPNDAPNGGCITVKFAHGIELANMGLMDLEEDNTKITVSATAKHAFLGSQYSSDVFSLMFARFLGL
jgi:hypothetical protein